MSALTLAASATLALATAAGFCTVGAVLGRASVGDGGRSAWAFFRTFWFSAAIIFATQGLGSLAGALGIVGFPLLQALDEVSSPFYCLAAAGLLYYVLYLLTGRARLLPVILTYYLALLVALRWVVASAGRTGIVVTDWQVNFTYTTPLQGPLYTAVVALIAGPLLLAIVAYGGLWFRVREPALRYRIACVSIGLLVWIATEAFSYTSGIASTPAGEIVRRAVALGSTVLVLAAYQPPRFARERWQAQPVVPD